MDFEATRAKWAKTIARTTSAAVNAADPYGDGDQSAVKASMPKDAGQSLIEVWSDGADFLPYAPFDTGLPDFIKDCFFGQLAPVTAAIAAAQEAGPTALHHLLEQRASLLRLSPLLSCIAGARCVGKFPWPQMRGCDHVAVAKALIDAGARVDCKDVAGYSAVHHCSTAMATAQSLDILKLLAAAGADVRAVNRAGRPPMLESVMRRRLDIVKALLAVGADPGQKDSDGIDSFKLAALWGEGATAMSEHTRLTARLDVLKRAAAGGASIRIHGLQKAPKWEGQIVSIESGVDEDGRCVVKAAAGDAVRVKIDKLQVVDAEGQPLDAAAAVADTASDACAGPGCTQAGSHRCSRCLSAHYCSSECQRAHWPAHKEACKAHVETFHVRTSPHMQPGLGGDGDGDGMVSSFISRKDGSVKTTVGGKAAGKGGSGSGSGGGGSSSSGGSRVFPVKVQTPLFDTSSTGGNPGPMLVYDESRSFRRFIHYEHAIDGYNLIARRVTDKGQGGRRAYFNAYWDAKDPTLLLVDGTRVLPPLGW